MYFSKNEIILLLLWKFLISRLHLGYSPFLSSGTSIKYLISLIMLYIHKPKTSYGITYISNFCTIWDYICLHASEKQKNKRGLTKLKIYFSLIWKKSRSRQFKSRWKLHKIAENSGSCLSVSIGFQTHGHLMAEDGGSELQPLCLYSRPQRGRREKSVNSLLLTSKRQNLDT